MVAKHRGTFRPFPNDVRILTLCWIIVLVFSACGLSQAADRAAIDDRLVGEWTGVSGSYEGETATIRPDSIALRGGQVPLRFVSPGVLMMGHPGEEEAVRYQLSGETLVVRSDSETSTWRRVAGPSRTAEGSAEPRESKGDSSGPARVDADPSRAHVNGGDEAASRRVPGAARHGDPGPRPLPAGHSTRVHDQDAKAAGEGKKSPAGATIFKEHKLTDPGMNNMVASTFLIPEDWTAAGELKRMPPSLYSIPVIAEVKFTAPDGRQVHFFPSLVFDFDNSQSGQVMQPTMKANLHMPLPQSPGTWLMEMARLSPDPGITHLKLVSEEEVPEVTKLLRQQNQPLIQQVAENNRLGAGIGLGSRFDTQATRIVLTYDRDGRSYEESVLVMWNYMVSVWQGQVTSGLWSIPAMYSMRGPAGTDYLNDPVMIAILGSVRINPAWQAEMNKYWAQLAGIQHKGNMDRLNASAAAHQKRMQTLNETSDILMSGWKSRNASQDRMQARTIDAIHEQTPYTTPSGETVKLPSFYNNVYTDGNGHYMLNNDSLYEPNTDPAVNHRNWQRIEAGN